MVSPFECIGLLSRDAEDLGQMLFSTLDSASLVGWDGAVEVLRWEDPSGGRIIATMEKGRILDVVPSFASTPGVRLSVLQPLNETTASAMVVDEAGEQTTAMAVELEQRRFLENPVDLTGLTTVVGMGLDVELHHDADAYGVSPSSLLDQAGDPDGTRLGAGAFISYGVFGDPFEATARARMSGMVLSAERRIAALTGLSFVVARVSAMGFEIDVCIPGDLFTEVPSAGQIIAGEVLMVADIPSLVPSDSAKPRRGGWLRR